MIKVDFLDGKKVRAIVNNHEVVSDQKIQGGGENSAPDPVDYFNSALAMCVGVYVGGFCDTRGLSKDGIDIDVDFTVDPENRFKRKFSVKISVPKSFPEKYLKALEASATQCTVKKIIENIPEFKYEMIVKNS